MEAPSPKAATEGSPSTLSGEIMIGPNPTGPTTKPARSLAMLPRRLRPVGEAVTE